MIALLLLTAAPAIAQDVLPAPREQHDLSDTHELPEGVAVYTAGALANLRAAPRPDAAVTRRLPAGTRARVVEDIGPWVEIRVGATQGWIARELVTTMGRVADLDGDGVEERIVVAQTLDGATRAWLREGDHVQSVVLHPYPDPYLGSWELVPAEQAGVALLRVDLDQDACGAYPSVWLSYTGDHLRTALELLPWADGGTGESYDVRYVEPGLVSVRTEAFGELGEHVSERACVLTEGVYHCS